MINLKCILELFSVEDLLKYSCLTTNSDKYVSWSAVSL